MVKNKSLFCEIVSLCSIFILISGCATTNPHSFSSPIPEKIRKQIRQVLIVPAKFEPQIDYHPFAKGRDVGAAKGAASGAAVGAVSGAGIAIGSVYGVLLLPFFVAGGAIIGGTTLGIAGALDSVPEEKAKQIEQTVDNALVKLDFQGIMAEKIYKAGAYLTDYDYTISNELGPTSLKEIPDYRSLNIEGADIILEVRVIRLGFKGGKGSNPNISMDMKINVKTINAISGKKIYSGIWYYVSKEHSLSEWVKNNSQRLHDEFENCYQSLSKNILERLFLSYEFHVASSWEGTQTCVLQSFYPEFKLDFFSWEGLTLAYPEIDSLQPTLKWEAFPREKDINGDKKAILKRIDEISYDLKIWKEKDFVQNKPLYMKQGIKKPLHKIEVTLEQSTNYFWTFRARFKLDDQYRVTKWAHSRIPNRPFEEDPCNLNYIPITHYYRFRTPSDK